MQSAHRNRRTFLNWRMSAVALVVALGAAPQYAVAQWNPYYRDFVCAAYYVGVPTSWAYNPALCQIVAHESSWRVSARNPNSTAFGLFQFLRSTWNAYLWEVPYGTRSAFWQAVGGFRYIRARYGTPERAWAFWQAHGWY